MRINSKSRIQQRRISALNRFVAQQIELYKKDKSEVYKTKRKSGKTVTVQEALDGVNMMIKVLKERVSFS
jgi:hypothetical protein